MYAWQFSTRFNSNIFAFFQHRTNYFVECVCLLTYTISFHATYSLESWIFSIKQLQVHCWESDLIIFGAPTVLRQLKNNLSTHENNFLRITHIIPQGKAIGEEQWMGVQCTRVRQKLGHDNTWTLYEVSGSILGHTIYMAIWNYQWVYIKNTYNKTNSFFLQLQ